MKQLKEKPDDYASTPIGTGPYKFVEWAKGQHIKLTANPDWWGQQPPPTPAAPPRSRTPASSCGPSARSGRR